MESDRLTLNAKPTGEPPAALLEPLIRAMAAQDKAALAALYQATRAAVYGYALSITANAADAEDVLQDTYVQAYAAAGRYQPAGKPMAWLLTIARNLALMRLRGAKRSAPLHDAEMLAALPDSVSGEDRLLLAAALQTLSAEERQIVMLHAVAGLKHREIAALHQLPLSTVLAKYHRALKKLRLKLTEGADA